MRSWLLTIGLIVVGLPAQADPGIANTGGLGFLSMPAAQPMRLGTFGLTSEMLAGFNQQGGNLGTGPIGFGFGLPPRAEFSFSIRDGGLGRDRPSHLGLVRSAIKLGLFEGGDNAPVISLEAYGDNLAATVVPGGRLLISSFRSGGVMVGTSFGYHGGRRGAGAGPEAAAAISWQQHDNLEWLGEAHLEGMRPWSLLVAGGARYVLFPRVSLTATLRAGVLGPTGIQAAVALNIHSHEVKPADRRIEVAPAVTQRKQAFGSDRPRFRMKIEPLALPGEQGYQPLQPEPSQPTADDLETIFDEGDPEDGGEV